jgi:hypothetical protein
LSKLKTSRLVSFGSIFAALTVLFQAAPVFLPVVGLTLSPFSTLPIALATILSLPLGIVTLFASALILFTISPQEAVILLVATGPLGLSLGFSFKKSFTCSVVTSSIVLFSGINILTYVIGVPTFGDFTDKFLPCINIILFLVFSFIYSCVWTFYLNKLIKRFRRITNFFY